MLLAVLLHLAGSSVPADPEAIRFKAETALVSDALGRPLFRASPAYLFPLAGNPGGKVVRYDSARRRVLVSAAAPEWWVDCDDLQPTGETCAPLRRRGANRGAADTPPSLDLARGVPSCPGDPRCPRRN